MSELIKNVTFNAKKLEVMSRPYTKKEMLDRRNENNFISGVIEMEMSDLIDNDFESILDIMSETLTGSVLLLDINYEFLAVKDGIVYVSVSGDVSSILDVDSDLDDVGEDANVTDQEDENRIMLGA